MRGKKALTYYTTEETAKILRVTPRTVYTFMKERGLRGYKIGKYWIFAEEDILEFIKKRESKFEIKKEEQDEQL